MASDICAALAAGNLTVSIAWTEEAGEEIAVGGGNATSASANTSSANTSAPAPAPAPADAEVGEGSPGAAAAAAPRVWRVSRPSLDDGALLPFASDSAAVGVVPSTFGSPAAGDLVQVLGQGFLTDVDHAPGMGMRCVFGGLEPVVRLLSK